MNHQKSEERTKDKSIAVGMAIAAILNIFLGLMLFGEDALGVTIAVSIGLLLVAVITALKGDHPAK